VRERILNKIAVLKLEFLFKRLIIKIQIKLKRKRPNFRQRLQQKIRLALNPIALLIRALELDDAKMKFCEFLRRTCMIAEVNTKVE